MKELGKLSVVCCRTKGHMSKCDWMHSKLETVGSMGTKVPTLVSWKHGRKLIYSTVEGAEAGFEG